MPRNPIRWNNVSSNVRSDLNGAMSQFSKSTKEIGSKLKDMYDRELQSNTIDAMEQIRAGIPVSVNGQVNRGAVLQFSIDDEKRRAKAKMDSLKYNREKQLYDRAVINDPLKTQELINKNAISAQNYNQNAITNPLDVISKQNKNKQDAYDYNQSAISDSYINTINKNKSKSSNQDQLIKDKLFGSKKQEANNLSESVKLQNDLQNNIQQAHDIRQKEINGEITGEEATNLYSQLSNKADFIKDRLNSLSRSNSFMKYGFTPEDVKFNSDGTVKPKTKNSTFTSGMLQYNKEVKAGTIKDGSRVGTKKALADSISGRVKVLATSGINIDTPTTYKENQKWLIDNKEIISKKDFLKKKIDDMRSKDVPLTNMFQTQWSMKNEIEQMYRDENDKNYEDYVRASIGKSKKLPRTKQTNKKLNLQQVFKAVGADTAYLQGIASNAYYDKKTIDLSQKIKDFKNQESNVKADSKQAIKIRKMVKKLSKELDLNKQQKQDFIDSIKKARM